MELGAKIRKMRKKRNLSVIELSQKCGIDRTVLYRIEAGKLSPRLSQVEKIAAGFEVNVMELLKGMFV